MNPVNAPCDLNEARYLLRKAKKSVTKNCRHLNSLSGILLVVFQFFDESGMCDQAELAQSTIDTLKSDKGCVNVVKDKIDQLLYATNGVSSLRKAMERKRCSAQAKINRNKYREEACVIRFDVVVTATQGGFHIAVVSSVGKYMIIVHPFTTADEKTLRTVGCKSVAITSCDFNPINGSRITSNATCVDKRDVKVIGHIYNTSEIENALRIMGRETYKKQ